jgi:hypothetical protein
MFEGNFPVDKGSCGYAALRNAFKRIDPRRCTKAVILNGYACSADR